MKIKAIKILKIIKGKQLIVNTNQLLLRAAEENNIQSFNKTIKCSNPEKHFSWWHTEFEIQIENIYRKTNQKENAFLRVTLYVIISQKQPQEVFCKKRCSKKFCKIHRKTPAPESLFLTKLQVEACNFVEKRDSDTGVLL